MTQSAGVAATAMAESRLAAFLWRSAGDLRLGVVLKATFRMHHEQRMQQIAPEPFLVGDENEPADDLIPFRQTADVWVAGFARKPRNEVEAALRLWVSRSGVTLIDRVVAIDRSRWGAGRLDLAQTSLGPVAHPSAFETAEGIIDLPADTDYERFQWARPEQRIVSLSGHEWVGVSGSVLAPVAVISQLPRVRATANVYYRDVPAACRPVALAADLIAVDAGAWTCSVTWHGQVDLEVEGEQRDLHVVGGVTTNDEELKTENPFLVAERTPDGAPGRKFATLPFQKMSAATPPSASETAAEAVVDLRATMVGAGVKTVRATPFDAPVPSSRGRDKLGTTLVEALVRTPATPFDRVPRRSPSEAPPAAFTSVPPSSLPPSRTFRAPHPVGKDTLDGGVDVIGAPATPFDGGPIPEIEPAGPASTTLEEEGAGITTLDNVGAALRETLPFDRGPKRPPPLVVAEAPKSDPTVLPFRTPKKSFGAAFLEAFASVTNP